MMSHEGQLKGAATNRRKALERDKMVLACLEDGWTYARIADHFGLKLTTVPTVILRARRRAGIGPTR